MMLLAFISVLAHALVASMNAKLHILVHRVKGSRSRKSIDYYTMESIHALIDSVYSGIPKSLAELDKAYISPCMLYKQQVRQIDDFAEFLLSLKPNNGLSPKAASSAFKSARKAFLSFHSDFKGRLDPHLKYMSSHVISMSDKFALESLIEKYWESVSNLIKMISSMTVHLAHVSAVPYAHALSSVTLCQAQLMNDSEGILLAASRRLIAGYDDIRVLGALVKSHQRANTLLLERLSSLRGDSANGVVEHVWLVDALNDHLRCFNGIKQSRKWIMYFATFKELSRLLKETFMKSQKRGHRELLQRQVKAMTLLLEAY